MKKFALFLTFAAVISFSASAHAVLEVRGLGTIVSGGEGSGGQYLLIYDTELDITWLDFTKSAHIWDVQMSWASAIVVEFNGQTYTDWRLPHTMPINGLIYNYVRADDGSTDFGFNISAPGSAFPGGKGSEMAHLYYFTLENLSPSYPDGTPGQPGWGLQNTGPFENLLNRDYWSRSEYAPISDNVWDFDFNSGWQGYDGRYGPHYAMAVYPGDVMPTIDDILEFFAESVTDGLIEGRGRKPWLANVRLWIFGQMLESVKWHLENDKIKQACKKLSSIEKRCDGEPRPKDFITGEPETIENLMGMLNALMESLQCD